MSTKCLKIEIIFDTICPWCYIGKKRFEKAINIIKENHPELKLTIIWRSYMCYPKLSAVGEDLAKTYIELFGGEERWKRVKLLVNEQAVKEDLNFCFSGILGSSLDSHRLMTWSLQFDKQDQLLEKLFHAHFVNGKNLGDRNVLLQICDELQLTEAKEFLESEALKNEILVQVSKFRSLPVRNGHLPHYIINDKHQITGALVPSVLALRLEQIIGSESYSPSSNL